VKLVIEMFVSWISEPFSRRNIVDFVITVFLSTVFSRVKTDDYPERKLG
jgi:hypothetical protein